MRRIGAVLAATVITVTTALVVEVAPAEAVRRTATVRSGGGGINIRTGPTTQDRSVGKVANGQRISVRCQVYGQGVRGNVRYSGYWDRIPGGLVADAYVVWRPNRLVPWCSGSRTTIPVVNTTAIMRSGAGTNFRRIGRMLRGTRTAVRCQHWGNRVSGPAGTSNAWYLLTNGRYIPGVTVTWQSGVPVLPWCGQAPWTSPTTNSGFITRVAGGARAGMRRYKVPASVTIAQAIQETGWGKSVLTRRDHNYFGIKCFGSPGPMAVGCRSYATTECGHGDCWRTRASFRAYRNISASMVDHGKFLAERPRYRPAFKFTKDANRFAIAIHKAGYATGPQYAKHLIAIMKKYNLYRYDR